jgi:hypothetical protein
MVLPSIGRLFNQISPLPFLCLGFKHKQQKVKEKIFHWLAFSGARGEGAVRKIEAERISRTKEFQRQGGNLDSETKYR